MVQQRAARAGRITEDDLGQHDAMIPGRHPRRDPADEPGQYAVEDGNTFRALAPTGGSAEAVGAAAGEGGGEFLLVLAEYVDADVLGLGDRGPAGGADTDAEGDDRGSAETELSEVAVKPTGPEWPCAVITATPAACCRKTERRRSGEAGCASGEASRKVSRSGVAVMESSFCEW